MLDLFRLFVLMCIIFFIKCDIQPFIINGTEADIEEFPHAAFFTNLCKEKSAALPTPRAWMCGASVVNEKILLTAGHCVAGCILSSAMDVTLGHSNREKSAVFIVSAYYLHENYRRVGVLNDIALIKLRTRLSFSSKVKRVALMRDPPNDETAVVAGWGTINTKPKELAVVLRYIKQFIWKAKACGQVTSRLPRGTICASSKQKYAYTSGYTHDKYP